MKLELRAEVNLCVGVCWSNQWIKHCKTVKDLKKRNWQSSFPCLSLQLSLLFCVHGLIAGRYVILSIKIWTNLQLQTGGRQATRNPNNGVFTLLIKSPTHKIIHTDRSVCVCGVQLIKTFLDYFSTKSEKSTYNMSLRVINCNEGRLVRLNKMFYSSLCPLTCTAVG